MPPAKTKTPSLPIERARLDNGLRVVMAPDRSSPGVIIAAYYDVGFRSEVPGRTGFAHLFEHLMFEGSVSLEKGMHDKLINGNGGILNGFTRNDFTAYFEVMPSNALELGLFLEADRMRGLRLTERNLEAQVAVVEEEVKVNVLNQPYGGFPWLWVPMVLFDTWPNAHNAYGEFADLEAATLDDAIDFFDRFYAPGNAVLCVAGDLDPAECLTLIERHFGDIPARAVPAVADAAEPIPTAEKREQRADPRAPQPALAISYRTPDPIDEFEDYVALVLGMSVLGDGDASRLYQRLMKKDRVASHMSAQVGLLEGPFEVRGPAMAQLSVWHPGEVDADRVIGAIDEEVEAAAGGIDDEELDRFRNDFLAGYLSSIDSLAARGMLIASLELMRGKAELINEIPAVVAAVTPARAAAVIEEWLRPERRAVLEWKSGVTG